MDKRQFLEQLALARQTSIEELGLTDDNLTEEFFQGFFYQKSGVTWIKGVV